MTGADWTMLQLADSAFPAGGMSHSAGLEAAWQLGLVGRDDLRAFVKTLVGQQGRAMVPFVVAAAREPAAFDAIDARCDATLVNHVANRASRAQGRSLASAADRVFAGRGLDRLARAAVGEHGAGGCPLHHAPAFGAVAAALGLDPPAAARLFLFVAMRGALSAAVRVGAVGPFEAQAVQHDLRDHAERVATLAVDYAIDDVAATAPLIDVAQGTQDRLYSRLFVS